MCFSVSRARLDLYMLTGFNLKTSSDQDAQQVLHVPANWPYTILGFLNAGPQTA